MSVALLEPEMSSNAGNIGRTCVATKTRLRPTEPLGFKLNEKVPKRAGLDYWDKLDVTMYSDCQDFPERNPDASGRIYFATTKAHKVYSNVEYEPDCCLMFGKESVRTPEGILAENEEHCTRIPMWGDARSLNLFNFMSVVLYGVLRQHGPEKMTLTGQLHYLSWNRRNIQGRLWTLRFTTQGGGLFLWRYGSYSLGRRTFTDSTTGTVCTLGNVKRFLMEGTISVIPKKV